MPLDPVRIKKLLASFEFKKLFIEELGWNHYETQLNVIIPVAKEKGVSKEGNETFALSAIAEKCGMTVFLCNPGNYGQIPDDPTRRKIERLITKNAYEHLIIFMDSSKNRQYWLWSRRETGRQPILRGEWYRRGETGERLAQKIGLLAISLEEEEKLTLPDVTDRARKAFDIERVTKKFYDCFKIEHAVFLKLIEGISDSEMERWYVSVMLNRLMFIYFIQKKGFLGGDTDYLKNKLAQSRRELGKDRYYRDLLCPLFFEGFAKQKGDRTEKTRKLLGEVPYLNGGIFMPHQIEQLHGKKIAIPDKAFEKLFEFFDSYHWHLDERPLKADNEINPDVLGYIFEKYINQKQMGAYYTKEDITGYISQNTIIPFLFDVTREMCKVDFGERLDDEGGGMKVEDRSSTIWRLLQEGPDRYIYKAVRHGITWHFRPKTEDKNEGEPLAQPLELPLEIAEGLDASKPNLLEMRKGWNKAATREYALPTEIWRDVVARRKRYKQVKDKLAAGEVNSINDLITLNLDIRQFAQDTIENAKGPELLVAFWKAIEAVTVLDPTCGSGAFLFAALNILDPLYEACLERMRFFLEEWGEGGNINYPNYHKLFTEILKRMEEHPNRRYFVLKSIIVNNLFGVDIMEEAVEICKLRFFLKLVAQIEHVGDIEPLPDIDFNIRAGNTLVGFAALAEAKKTQEGKLGFGKSEVVRIEEEAENADHAFCKFRELQTEQGVSTQQLTKAKEELSLRLKNLTDELDRFLAGEYHINESKIPDKSKREEAFKKWRESHRPFHWFAEFYGILKAGGFDVIIGNPPYVSSTKVRRDYTLKGFSTEHCPDIYAWVMERASLLTKLNGRNGMICPLSLSFSNDFSEIRHVLFSAYAINWFSFYGRIPSALFSYDVRVRNTIHLAKMAVGDKSNYSTRLHRWFDAARPHLFSTLEYASFKPELWRGRIPKLNTQQLANAFEKLLYENKSTMGKAIYPHPTKNVLYFKKTAYNWLNFCRELPPCYNRNGHLVPHTKFGKIFFSNLETLQLAMLLANGKLMMAFWLTVGDDFDVTRWNFEEFPIDLEELSQSCKTTLLMLAPRLETAMKNAVQFKVNAGRKVGNYNLAKCRDVTDESDALFCSHLGLSHAWEDIELYYGQTVKTDFDAKSEDD